MISGATGAKFKGLNLHFATSGSRRHNETVFEDRWTLLMFIYLKKTRMHHYRSILRTQEDRNARFLCTHTLMEEVPTVSILSHRCKSLFFCASWARLPPKTAQRMLPPPATRWVKHCPRRSSVSRQGQQKSAAVRRFWRLSGRERRSPFRIRAELPSQTWAVANGRKPCCLQSCSAGQQITKNISICLFKMKPLWGGFTVVSFPGCILGERLCRSSGPLSWDLRAFPLLCKICKHNRSWRSCVRWSKPQGATQ